MSSASAGKLNSRGIVAAVKNRVFGRSTAAGTNSWRPAIAKINFVGLKEFESDVIIKALKETGIAEGRIFDRAQLEKAEQELKRQYLTRGKYGATITTTITPLERNRVSINFTIEEGAAARIKQINVVGATAFKEARCQSRARW